MAENADADSSSGGSPTALDDRMPRACGDFLSRCTFITRGIVSAPCRSSRVNAARSHISIGGSSMRVVLEALSFNKGSTDYRLPHHASTPPAQHAC